MGLTDGTVSSELLRLPAHELKEARRTLANSAASSPSPPVSLLNAAAAKWVNFQFGYIFLILAINLPTLLWLLQDFSRISKAEEKREILEWPIIVLQVPAIRFTVILII